MTATSRCLNDPPKGLAEYRQKLRGERIMALLSQMEAETAGCDTVAEHHAREIARIDARLREIEGASGE